MTSSREKAAWAILCPTCKANVGHGCVDYQTGRYKVFNHPARNLEWANVRRATLQAAVRLAERRPLVVNQELGENL